MSMNRQSLDRQEDNAMGAELAEVKAADSVGESVSKELLKKHEAFITISEVVPIAFWFEELYPNGRLKSIHYSDEMLRMLGYSRKSDFPDELDTIVNALHPDDRKRMLDAAIAAGTGKSDGYDIEYRIKKADGTYMWVNSTGKLIKDDKGAPVGMYGAFIDIDARKTKDLDAETIRQQNEELEIFLKLNKTAVWSMECTPEGRLASVHWSDNMRHLLGYESAEDFPDTMESLMNILHPDDRKLVQNLFYSTLNDPSADTRYETEYRLRLKNGEWHWFHATGESVRNEMGIPVRVYGTFADINDSKIGEELRELNDRLAKQQEALEKALMLADSANRAKTTFLNNMSHDIRTPMNAIIGYTGLAASHIDNKEQVQDYLAKIGQSSDHLLSLINDVLDMSRIESGKMNLEEKPENLSEILHSLRNIVLADVNAKELDFFIDSVDVNDEDVICDRLRLNQVLLNILSNAIKYTQSGGTVSLRISEKSLSRNGYAEYEFRVKDNGMGMSEDFVEHIFDSFSRAKSSTVSGIQGTGLGMAIAKSIVDMMGGTIKVKSKEGEGTEVTVNLRFKLAAKHKEPERIAELEGLRGLVVDDNSDTCASVYKMLRDIGMRSDWCTSGKEAVTRAKIAKQEGDSFHVYVIDWLMPDMNGIETTRRIRHVIGDDAPIIILTAYDWSDIEDEAREAGVTAFVSKPLFPSDLHRVLEKCCGHEVEKVDAGDSGNYDFAGRRILLVEDNEMNREIAQEILQEAGFEVETASDGTYAVERMEKALPGELDLILMDIQMPEMDGYVATKAIRSLTNGVADIPIIAMTANAFSEDRENALVAGMNDHIAKPIDIVKLKETIAKLL